MLREMRRGKQELSQEESIAILARGTSGVLAVQGDDDYPYAVPLSYVLCGSRILFHCAKSGHKLDAIQKHNKASFCVIDRDEVVPEEYTTYYQSVIVFGRARVLVDEAQRRHAMECLAAKYSPSESEERRQAEIEKTNSRVCVVELTLEHITGKAAVECL